MRTRPPVARGDPSEQRLVLACLPDGRARNRVESALRGHAMVRWFSTFDEVRESLESCGEPATAVIGLCDGSGGTALEFAHGAREELTGTAIVVCCDFERGSLAPVAALAEAGVHDVLLIGINDDGRAARRVIFGAALGGAADVVMRSVRTAIPAGLMRFVDLVVRHPREIHRVNDVAAALHIPRQTLCRWCRRQGYLRPEELLVWARLLLVAALLESSPRTLEAIAADLCYGSPAALRNRIREYTGMTSKQIRAGGIDLVLEAFERRVTEVRALPLPSREQRRAKVG